MGCCIENACQADGGAGCPLASLAGAHLPDNAAKASAWSPTGGPSSTSAAASSTSSATPSDSSSPVGAIAGGVVGGIAVLLVVVGVLLWRRRRKAKEKAKASAEDSNAPAPVSELSAGRSVRAKGSPLPPRYSAISNSYAFELDGYPRKAPNTPSELGGDEVHAELPGDDAVHELEGNTIASTPASGSGGGGGHSRGSSWSSTEKKQRWSGPRGLAITGWGGHGRSPRSSPRSPNFPQNRGGQEGGDDHTEISSLPSTPRSPYTGTGNYSEVSRLSPTHPPPIIEDEGDDRYDPDMRERRDER
ncbi:hypothetical protein SLS56_011506 [Neofusicoccum ribis]|uniref:Uncharacterized protein n=1 Tax=Neofusicoccum ribis TaxID=45134 RepID=A0ABR3SC21_9PEZI